MKKKSKKVTRETCKRSKTTEKYRHKDEMREYGEWSESKEQGQGVGSHKTSSEVTSDVLTQTESCSTTELLSSLYPSVAAKQTGVRGGPPTLPCHITGKWLTRTSTSP